MNFGLFCFGLIFFPPPGVFGHKDHIAWRGPKDSPQRNTKRLNLSLAKMEAEALSQAIWFGCILFSNFKSRFIYCLVFPLENSPQTGWCPVHTCQERGNEDFKSQAGLRTLTFLFCLKRCLQVFLSSWLVLFFTSLWLPCVSKGVHALTCQDKNIRDPIVISKDIGQTWAWRQCSYLLSLTYNALAEHKTRFPNCTSEVIFSVCFKHLCL